MAEGEYDLAGCFQSRYIGAVNAAACLRERAMVAVAVLLAALCSCAPVQASEPKRRPRTQTSGLALSVGIGWQYAVVGGQAMYYLQIPDTLLRVAPYSSLGRLCLTSQLHCNLGAAFGAIGSWGDKHRLLLDLAYGTVAGVTLSPHGRAIDNRAVWGLRLEAGYEYMAFGGFVLRGGVGVSYALSQPLFTLRERVGLAFTLLGVGYKLW